MERDNQPKSPRNGQKLIPGTTGYETAMERLKQARDVKYSQWKDPSIHGLFEGIPSKNAKDNEWSVDDQDVPEP